MLPIISVIGSYFVVSPCDHIEGYLQLVYLNCRRFQKLFYDNVGIYSWIVLVSLSKRLSWVVYSQ